MDISKMVDPIQKLITGDNQIQFGYQILIRITLSIFLAALFGIERANKRHAAGLRTFIIVSLSSTISALVDIYLIVRFNIVFPALSIAMAIGIAIISSYTILYSSRNQIKGLTTAVALWAQAFIGFSIGFERIVMLLLENGFEVPGSGEKKAYLIEKGMPSDKMQKILSMAAEERKDGKIVNLSIMKKNKKFQKEKMQQEGYTEFVEFFTDRDF